MTARNPYIVYAKYIAERSLTKVMLHKTETRIEPLLSEVGDVDILMKLKGDILRANQTVLTYVVNTCIHIQKVVDPEDDPYLLHRDIVPASLRVLLQGGACLTKITRSLRRDVDEDALLPFSIDSATKAVVSAAQLVVQMEKAVVQVLHTLHGEGLGSALISQLDENEGAVLLAYLKAQQSLVTHTREEVDACRQKEVARDDEKAKASALAEARKEAKKGKRELKERFKEATEEHEVALQFWQAQAHTWEIADNRAKTTGKALERISLQLCHVIDCAGVFCMHVREAKVQAMEIGIVDVLCDLLSQENLDENAYTRYCCY